MPTPSTVAALKTTAFQQAQAMRRVIGLISMAFPTYRLPPDIEEGAQGGPEFSTVIQESVSGQEQRVKVWAKCRARYDIAYSVLHSDDPVGSYQAVLALFYAHNGRFRPFRFKDWGDYQATDTSFGTGDGSDTTFQLSKTYDPSQILLDTPGSFTYTREIYLLAHRHRRSRSTASRRRSRRTTRSARPAWSRS